MTISGLTLQTDKMLFVVEDGIGWLTFNQPEKRNAINLAMADSLGDILEYCQENDDVRIVVMRGAGGKAFVAGADISEFKDNRSNAHQRAEYAKRTQRGYSWLDRLDKPLIALIDGFCIGGGLAVAISADIRFATPSSKFGIPAARLGLGYGYEGINRLVGLVGPATASDILFSARFMSAEEAYSKRLINFVVDQEKIENDVRNYALQIANNAPLTIKAAKASIKAVDDSERDLGLLKEMVDACFNSEDYQEGITAFAEKRKPIFRSR